MNATAAAVATAAALANANNKPGGGSGSGVMQPPPGVTNPMVNPSNQFLMSLPFVSYDFACKRRKKIFKR